MSGTRAAAANGSVDRSGASAGAVRRRPIDRLHPVVLPILMFSLLSAGAALLFGQLHATREAARLDRFARVGDEAVELVHREIGTRLRLLAHLAAGVESGALADARDFSQQATDLEARFPGFVAINRVGPDRIITVVTPRERNTQALGRRLGQSAEVVAVLDEAERTRAPKATRLTDLFQGGKGVATYFPLWRDGAFVGYVNGVLAPAAILEEIQRVLEPAVRISLAEAVPGQPTTRDDRTYVRRIDVLDRAWAVTVRSDLFAASPVANPDLWGLLVAVAFSALASGFLFTALHGRRRALTTADRFAEFAETSSDLLWEKDADLRFSYFSDRLLALTGIRPATVLGRRPHDMPPMHTDPATWRAHLERLDAHQPFRDFVFGFAGEDGAVRYLRTSGRPRFDDQGRFLGYRGTATNVTTEVMAQTAAARAHERLVQAVELMPAGFLLFDADEKLVLANDGIRRGAGLAAIPAPGTPLADVLRATARNRLGPTAPGAAIEAEVAKRLAELRGGTSDNERMYARGRWNRSLNRRTPTGDLVCIRVDVTPQRKAAEALEVARAELKSILDNTIDGLITIDQDGTVLSFSRPAEWMFGHAATEVVGRDVRLILPEIGPADPADLVGAGREMEGRAKDGTAIPIDLAVAELPGADGVRRYVVTVRDIRARKATEEQLRQAQKMEAVGQLTGGIAHDFNNLLQVILGNLEMLVETAAADSPAGRQLAAARRAAQRGAELNRRLLAFSRRQPLDPRPTDLKVAVDGLRELLARTLGETVSLELDFAPDLAACMVDRNQMENALINLALNARDAMPGGGRIVVGAGNHAVAADDLDSLDLAPGRYVRLSIADNGTGMTEDARRRAFDPFFTTKAVGKGSGLGLSMVYGFAKQSGGHVRIDSMLGQGTTVTLYLPQASDAAAAATPPGASRQESDADNGTAPPTSYRGRTVLVVEDEPAVRAWVTTQFAAFGFEVLQAASGPEARAALQAGAHLDLLFADVVLPGGSSGFDLAAEFRRAQPHMKVIFSSGYAETEIERGGGPPPDSIMLAKPYRRADLAAAVHRALR